MTQDLEMKVSPNGHEEEESQEQLQAVHKRLTELKGPDGQLVTLGKQELSLLKQILAANSDKYNEQMMWRLCSFMDDNEAFDHVAAFYEAKETGLDTGFNVAFAFALCSVNRKGNFANNLIGAMTDTLQMGKHAWTPNKKGNNGNSNPRSPIGN